MLPGPRPPSNQQFLLLAITIGLAIVIAGAVIAQALIAAPASLPITPQVIVRTVERVLIVTATPDPPTSTPIPSPTPSPQPTPTAIPTPTPTPSPTPLPPPRWRELGDLSSVEYTATTVVERVRARPGISGLLLGDDRVTMLVVGKIRAGVDLSGLRPSDVQTNDRRIRVRLPRARVLSVELLPEASRIFDSRRSWLFSEYEGLEVEAMDEARRRLREEATQNAEMLGIAETLARLQLTEFLRKAGFQEIEITFQP